MMQPTGRANPNVIYPGAAALVLGLAVSFMGSYTGSSVFDPNEVVGPALFWLAIGALLFAIPLRRAAQTFLPAVRRPLGVGVFFGYLTVHLLLYGFLLDAVFAAAYGEATLAQGFAAVVSTNVFLPPSPVALFFDLTYNPAMVISFPPVFGVALTFYAVAVAVVIAVLVLANVERARRLGELRTRTRKARSYFVVPVVGIVLGASCCLSVAGVVTLAVPAAATITSIAWIYYLTYFFFPALAAVLLQLNLRSIERLSVVVASAPDGGALAPSSEAPLPPPVTTPPK